MLGWASQGKAVARVCKRCNTQEMNIHHRDILKAVSSGCHGVVVLVVPDRPTLIRLPAYSWFLIVVFRGSCRTCRYQARGRPYLSVLESALDS